MKTIKLNLVNENIYYEKLDNGLEIYVASKKDFNTSYACFLTNFGGLDIEFIPINEKEMVKMPTGIAHFLEHKLFEQEKGDTVHEFYKKSGSYVNAMTSNKTTRYIFDSSINFKENLLFLLDYVQSPYFTNQNVEKEKGIILEEESMTRDNPNRLFFQTVNMNLFNEVPYYNKVIGTREDIKSITKEDLYRCYNSFYHPSNMALFVVSELDAKEVIELVKNNQKKKKFDKDFKIVKKEYDEKEEVKIKKEVIYGNINETRVSYSLKIKSSRFNALRIEIEDYINIFLSSSIGSLSDFNLDLKKKNIINDNIEFEVSTEETKNADYTIINIVALTNKPNLFIKLLEKELNTKKTNKKDFDLYMKTLIADLSYQFNMPQGIMNFMVSEYLDFHKVSSDNIDIEMNMNYDKFKKIIKIIDTTNKSIVIMKKEKQTML